MNIYFACSITGGRDDEAIYAAIVEALLENGHTVPTAILASPKATFYEEQIDPVEVYTRDIQWINECDVLVAEVTTPSHGVGIEINHALSIDKPVLCCYRKGTPVSKMILGNTNPRLTIQTYETKEEAVRLVLEYLQMH